MMAGPASAATACPKTGAWLLVLPHAHGFQRRHLQDHPHGDRHQRPRGLHAAQLVGTPAQHGQDSCGLKGGTARASYRRTWATRATPARRSFVRSWRRWAPTWRFTTRTEALVGAREAGHLPGPRAFAEALLSATQERLRRAAHARKRWPTRSKGPTPWCSAVRHEVYLDLDPEAVVHDDRPSRCRGRLLRHPRRRQD